jgi:transmembrane sensor
MSHENGTTDSAERRQRVAEEAGEWLLRLQRGDLSKEQRAQFVDWLREAPVHVMEMLRVSQVDAVLREFGGWQDIAPLGPPQPSSSTVVTLDVARQRDEPQRARARVRWWIPAAIAAGLSVLALGLWTMSASGWERVETRAAERRELALADGSVVQLAPGSKLRVHLEPRIRRIVLSRGEAFFRVARDGRPFIVETEYATVRATGTAFAVERESEGVVVTVAEGKVVVQGAQIDRATGAAQAVALAAGEQVTAPRAGPVGAIRLVDAARELSWTIGHLIFDRDSVFDAASRFNRYNKTQLRIADAALGERRISGVFDSSDPQSFVSFLESALGARVARPSANEVVLSAPAGSAPATP